MTQETSSHEQEQSPANTSELSRKLGGVGAQDAKPLDGSLDTQTLTTKAQTVIELVKRGNDEAPSQILSQDFPEKFTSREVSDFSVAVEERYGSGNPMFFHDYNESLSQWGIPMLRSSDNAEAYGYSHEDEVEHYTELLDDALTHLGHKELIGQLVDGEVIEDDGEPIVDAYVLGSSYSAEDDILRETDVEVIGSPFEGYETRVEAVDGKTIVRNALVRLMYGYEDKSGPTERAAYVTDISVNEKGKITSVGEPVYISVHNGDLVKDFPKAEQE